MGHFMRFDNYFLKVDEEKWLNIAQKIMPNLVTRYTPEETITRAEDQLGSGEYNIVMNNCEHFVFWCKFGIRRCYQGLNKRGRIYLDCYNIEK